MSPAPPILADLMLAVKLNMDLSPSRLVLLACQYINFSLALSTEAGS